MPDWGVRPPSPEDREFLEELRDGAAPASGTRVFVIEAGGERAGAIVLSTRKKVVRIEDFRLLPEWQDSGIQADSISRIRTWALETGSRLAEPKAGAFPGAAAIRAADESRSGCLPWLVWTLGFPGILVVLGVPEHWFRRYLGVDLYRVLMAVLLAFAAPTILAELHGRMRGGRVLLDLGNPSRGWWLAGSGGLLFLAFTFFFPLADLADDAAGHGRVCLVLALFLLVLGLCRGQLRERGILRPGFPGFHRYEEVHEWGREGDRLTFRHRPLAIAHSEELKVRLPPEAAERAEAILRPLLEASSFTS